MAAFKLIRNSNWYLGASTDTKPGAGTCPAGSAAYETGTGNLYITPDGGTTWTLKVPETLLVTAAGVALIGQAAMAASVPVVIASNQSAVPVSVASGSDVALGATTDAAASATTDEDGTARTGIGLWKGIKNILLDLKGLLAGGLPAALGAGGGLKVDGSGTTLPVSGTVTANQGTAGAAAWLASISSVTAACLRYGKQTVISITCTLANTDYLSAAVIPAGTKYLHSWADNTYKIAVDEATAAGLGPLLPASPPTIGPIVFGHASGDSKVHVQSATAGTVVNIWFAFDAS